MPAWPMWMEMHSLIFLRDENGRYEKKEKNAEVSVYEDATPSSLWQNDPFFWFGFFFSLL